MGRSHGPGSPVWFRCTKCRSTLTRQRLGSQDGFAHDVELTGRQKPFKSKRAQGSRSTFISREYRCKTCGFVGWSCHRDLAERAGEHPDLHLNEDGSTYMPSWSSSN